MSSYITAAQLEAQRKEALRKRLNDSINSLRENLSECTSNDTGSTISYGNVHSVVINDETSGVFLFSGEIGQSLLEGVDASERETMDFSSLLSAGNSRGKKKKRLYDSLKRINDRAILYVKDEIERKRTEESIRQILDNENLDIDSKIELINIKIENYLRSGTLNEDVDTEYIESRFQEYIVLCQMLGVEPSETLFEKVEQKCVSMKQELQKREEDKYIADTIAEIMEELGCTLQGTSILQHIHGEMYRISGCNHCEVFVGRQGNSILFEPVIESRDGSENYRKSVQSDIVSVCSLYEEIERRAAERGVILRKVVFEPVSVETATIDTKKDANEFKKKKKQVRNKDKERQLGDN